jgi:alpha-L-glutamate ligase-like protein
MKSLLNGFHIRSDRVVGMNHRNIELILPRNERRHFPLANNKLLTKITLAEQGIPVSPTITTFESFYEIGQIETRLENLHEFVVKPARGSGGNGILVISGREGRTFFTPGGRQLTVEHLRRHIADIIFGVYSFDKMDVAVVEPRLTPDAFFASLYPHGLSDIRLVLVDDVLSLSMLRIPTAQSDGKANLHQGAIGIAVNVENGLTYRAWHRGRKVSVHPENDIPLIYQRVPSWTEVVRIAVQTARALPLKYLGVDMVIDNVLGPLVLEVNARPGIEIQNVTGKSLLDFRQNANLEPQGKKR